MAVGDTLTCSDGKYKSVKITAEEGLYPVKNFTFECTNFDGTKTTIKAALSNNPSQALALCCRGDLG